MREECKLMNTELPLPGTNFLVGNDICCFSVQSIRMLIDNLKVSGILLPADRLDNKGVDSILDEFGPIFMFPCVSVDRFQ